jgi:murein DD-endopeptidase MepM/ murein hydrolase activator NlpD
VAAAAVRLPRRPFRTIRLLEHRIFSHVVQQRRLVFPIGGSVIRIGFLALNTRRCRQAVVLRSLSLFRGVITAAVVSTRLDRNGSISTRIGGLRVNGRPVADAGRRVRLGRWGGLALRRRHAALLVRLLKRHAGLPAGTAVLIAVAAAPAATSAAPPLRFQHPARAVRGRSRRRKRSQVHGPLKVTPTLGGHRYVFPVAGSATFGDSYGAFRADVSGNWHHGDDIFAPLGTPVVAVASGTLNRVGWEPIGGWRLWVRDRRGNEFYYAHLSGYAPLTLHDRGVEAGEVIGFVGNTGDAFTTPSHLHFEIHPHQLLSLHYDGAVDPTSYLNRWRHADHARVPKPTLPPLPGDVAGPEARYVFRKLLAARGLARPPRTSPPKIRLPGHDRPSQPLHLTARPAGAAAATSLRLALISVSAGAVLTILAAGVGLRLRRRH